jgi:hypothetical protein
LIQRAKRELAAEYGARELPAVGNPMLSRNFTVAHQVKRPDLMMIEDKGSGISLRQMLAAEKIETFPYNPGKADKLSRLHSVSHVAAGGVDPGTKEFIPGKHGRIWVIESNSPRPNKKGLGGPGMPLTWVEPMLEEVCAYSGPGTTEHDDDVDCFSMSCRYFADHYMSAGIDGKHATNSQTVNFDIYAQLGAEFVEGEDRHPGQTHYEEEIDNPYG